jgi:hypothetical protein
VTTTSYEDSIALEHFLLNKASDGSMGELSTWEPFGKIKTYEGRELVTLLEDLDAVLGRMDLSTDHRRALLATRELTQHALQNSYVVAVVGD